MSDDHEVERVSIDKARYITTEQAYAQARVNEALDRAQSIILEYKIPVGNGPSGELACEWTYDALTEIIEEIRTLKKEKS